MLLATVTVVCENSELNCQTATSFFLNEIAAKQRSLCQVNANDIEIDRRSENVIFHTFALRQ